jgi:hypothetical protein
LFQNRFTVAGNGFVARFSNLKALVADFTSCGRNADGASGSNLRQVPLELAVTNSGSICATAGVRPRGSQSGRDDFA